MWNLRTQMKWRSHPNRMDGGQLMVKGAGYCFVAPPHPPALPLPWRFSPSKRPLLLPPTWCRSPAQIIRRSRSPMRLHPNAPAPPCIRDLHLPISPPRQEPLQLQLLPTSRDIDAYLCNIMFPGLSFVLSLAKMRIWREGSLPGAGSEESGGDTSSAEGVWLQRYC